jgi:tetratricopeptide (TPR) repeat protein
LEDPDLNSCLLTFSPDGTKLLALHQLEGIHVWDLQRIRSSLVRMDQDWDAPAREALDRASSRQAGQPSVSPAGSFSPAMVQPAQLLAFAAMVFHDADVAVGLGQACAGMGWHEPALWNYTRALGLRPNQGEALLRRGEEYLRGRQWAKAIRDLSRAAEFPALRTSALQYRSLAYLQMGETGRAEADRQLLRAAFPDFSAALSQRATLHIQNGDEALGTIFLEGVLHFKRAPHFAEACNNLAWLYVTGPTRFRDPPKAVELAEKAVELEKTNWNYENTLGVSYYRVGRFQDAVATLGQSLRTGAGRADAFDLYFLALSHHHLGRKDLARACLDQAQAWHERPGRALSRYQAKELRRFRAEAEAAIGREN